MQEHLIIDGNNALHSIPTLAKELARDRNSARESLIHYLEPLQSSTDSLLTIVFDGRGEKGNVYKHKGLKNFTIIYSSSTQGADGVIERMLLAAKYPENISVATNDNLIRNCAFEAGASAIKVEELIKKLDNEISRTKIRLNLKSSPENGPLSNRIQIPDIK